MTETLQHPLLLHPTCVGVVSERKVTAVVRRTPAALVVQFRIADADPMIRVPPVRAPQRRDGLWRHTCCEIFVGSASGTDYVECNAAPSGEWAIYHFSDTREPLPEWPAQAPQIVSAWDDATLIVSVTVSLGDWPGAWATSPLRVGLSVVLEYADGMLAYHAVSHPREVPDFHDPRTRLIAVGVPDVGNSS